MRILFLLTIVSATTTLVSATTTLAPTTSKPTSKPTTLAPSSKPTTLAPTTSPTTSNLTSSPTTRSPTTRSPTTQSPTPAPTAAAPTTLMAFSATFSGYSTPTVGGTAFNGATVSTTNVDTPISSWAIGDTQVTYNGTSGLAFYYSSNAVFVSDTANVYWIYPIINGGSKLEDRSIFSYTIPSIAFQGFTFGSRVFTNGDILQIGIDSYASGETITPNTITLHVFRIA